MSKIVLGIGSLWQGGGERVCVNLANEITRKGYEVEIVVSSLERACYLPDLDSRVTVTEISSRNLFTIFLFYLNFFTSRSKVNFISFNYNITFVVSLVRLFRNVYLVSRSINTLTKEIGSDSGFKGWFKKLMIVTSLNMSDKVIAQSIGMKNDLLENGVKDELIKVINNPVSPSFAVQGKNKEQYVLYAGRLVEQKNLFELINIFHLVDEDIFLYIAGDGPLREDLLRYVSDNGLASRVIFLGLVPDMKKYYASAICTVLTSNYEGFPNVLIESIACGTPVVSFDCPNGPSEIIINGVNGYLIRFGDKEAFAQKVNDLYRMPLNPFLVCDTAEKYKSEYIANEYLKVLVQNGNI